MTSRLLLSKSHQPDFYVFSVFGNTKIAKPISLVSSRRSTRRKCASSCLSPDFQRHQSWIMMSGWIWIPHYLKPWEQCPKWVSANNLAVLICSLCRVTSSAPDLSKPHLVPPNRQITCWALLNEAEEAKYIATIWNDDPLVKSRRGSIVAITTMLMTDF